MFPYHCNINVLSLLDYLVVVFKSPVAVRFLPYLGATATLTSCQIRKFVTTATATAKKPKKTVATDILTPHAPTINPFVNH
jgi:hypothetical protein